MPLNRHPSDRQRIGRLSRNAAAPDDATRLPMRLRRGEKGDTVSTVCLPRQDDRYMRWREILPVARRLAPPTKGTARHPKRLQLDTEAPGEQRTCG
jgi:hypothetical protein